MVKDQLLLLKLEKEAKLNHLSTHHHSNRKDLEVARNEYGEQNFFEPENLTITKRNADKFTAKLRQTYTDKMMKIHLHKLNIN